MSFKVEARGWRDFVAGRHAGLLVCLVLAGCSSVPLPPEPSSQSASASTSVATQPQQKPSTARPNLPVLPPAGSGRGGYYMDDGPGDATPEGLHELADAEPRIEPYTKRGNKPYVVFGKRYVPFTDDRPYKERGIGSWYGKKFHGQTTSSGELYDMYKMTAAHPTLPLPSYARVTNITNGKQVIVRVNDRGPFHAGRVIDLSYTAALKLDYLANGSAQLEVERLLPDEILRMTAQRNESAAAGPDAGGAVIVEVAAQDAPQRVALAPLPVAEPAALIVSMGQPASAEMPAAGIYLQLGAYSQAQNAEMAKERFMQPGLALPPIQVVEQNAFYRLFSGPFASRTEAEQIADQLQRRVAVSPLIVQR